MEPELIKNPITGKWVLILDDNRYLEPVISSKKSDICEYCKGNEHETGKTISESKDENGWAVRVIPYFRPVYRVTKYCKKGEGITLDKETAKGAHEVVIETPQHGIEINQFSKKQLISVLYMYKDRMVDLKKDSEIEQVLIFKDQTGIHRERTENHSHSFIIASPHMLDHIENELRGAKEYFGHRGRCGYCDTIEDHIKYTLVDTGNIVAFTPLWGSKPYEVLITTKKHKSSFAYIENNEIKDLAEVIKIISGAQKKLFPDTPITYGFHTLLRVGEEEEFYHHHLIIRPNIRVKGFESSEIEYTFNPALPKMVFKELKQRIIGD